MQVSVDTVEGLQRRMSVELPSEQLDDEVNKRLKDLSRTVRMDGFRPGKVPMSMVKSRFGAQVKGEVFGELIDKTFYQAVSQEKLVPAGAPQIEPMDDGKVGYIATFEVMPEIEIGDLSAASVKTPVATVEDNDVDEMIEKLRKQRATFNDVERDAVDGDRLTISFKGSIDGEAFEGGSADDVPLVLGSGSMIDGFEEGLVGAKAGDSRTLALKFPDEYRAEHLAGKDVSFEVDVTKVEEQVLPELDEELVKTFGIEEGTVEALRTEIRANMERELAAKVKSVTKNRVMDALLEVVTVDVPKALVDEEAKRMKEQANNDMAASGRQAMDLPDDMFRDGAQRRVRLGLIMGEFARANEISADDASVKAVVEDMAQGYESPAEFVDYYMNNKEQRASIEALVLEDLAVEKMLGMMQKEDESSSFEALMEGNA